MPSKPSDQSDALTTNSNIDLSCSSLKALSPDIIRVWEGYRPTESDEERQNWGRIFVVVVKRKIYNLNEKVSNKEPFRIVQKLADEVSGKAKVCLQKETGLAFTLQEHSDLRDTLLRNAENLMKSHSNLELVSVSKIKSKDSGHKIEENPCLVMYVHVKGIIPVNEMPFPEKVEGFIVDVREGVFNYYNDPKLAIGSTIRGNDKCGKIAGFVQLRTGN